MTEQETKLHQAMPQDVGSVIARLQTAGYEAWAVGGCVRDTLLGRVPKDYDVASSCPAAIIPTLFENSVATGLAYGTVTVLTQSMPVEVTTFREESDYSDSRHPDYVLPTDSIITDLSRRDFTINAIAWNPSRGLCDPFGGQGDIQHCIVRAVGQPERRFGEDALRILRCLRFSSELDFDIDEKTYHAALTLCPTLCSISIERITAEVCRLLTGQRPQLMMALAKAGGLAMVGLANTPENEDASALPNIPPMLPLRLAAFLHLADGNNAQKAVPILRLDKKTVKETQALLGQLQSPLPANEVQLKRAFAQLSPADWPGLLAARESLLHEDTQRVRAWLEITQQQPWNRSMLAIHGDDIIALGCHGMHIKQVLNGLLEHVLLHPEDNTHAKLLALANEFISE